MTLETKELERLIKKHMGNEYSLGECIGEGTSAQVFNLRGGKETLVIKVVDWRRFLESVYEIGIVDKVKEMRYKTYQELVKMVRRETKLLKELKGKINITEMVDCFEECTQKTGEPDLFFVVQKKYECLKEYVRNEEVSEETVIQIAKDICQILVYLEEKKVLHRDIKADNIFVQKKFGEIQFVLGDFGVAREGTIYGKVVTQYGSYIAPEIIAKSKAKNYNADIYSLGVTLLKLLSTKSTIEHERQTKTLQLKHVSRELRKIILKASNPDCNKRYKDAKMMLKDLEKLVPEKEKTYYLCFEETLYMEGEENDAKGENSEKEDKTEVIKTLQSPKGTKLKKSLNKKGYDIRKLYDEAIEFKKEDLPPLYSDKYMPLLWEYGKSPLLKEPEFAYRWGWIQILNDRFYLGLRLFQVAASNGHSKAEYVYNLLGTALEKQGIFRQNRLEGLKWRLYDLYNEAKMICEKGDNAEETSYSRAWELYFSKQYFEAWRTFSSLGDKGDEKAKFITDEWANRMYGVLRGEHAVPTIGEKWGTTWNLLELILLYFVNMLTTGKVLQYIMEVNWNVVSVLMVMLFATMGILFELIFECKWRERKKGRKLYGWEKGINLLAGVLASVIVCILFVVFGFFIAFLSGNKIV